MEVAPALGDVTSLQASSTLNGPSINRMWFIVCKNLCKTVKNKTDGNSYNKGIGLPNPTIGSQLILEPNWT